MRPLAVFDIDGVLADVSGRLHHLRRRPKDWDAFFAEVGQDPVLEPGRALVLRAAQDTEVVYLTGRPERCREDTEAWLQRAGLPEGPLLMRGADDRRPARLTKPAALARLAGDREVAVVVDDDVLVCRAMRAAGYPVLQADWAPDPEAQPELFAAQELHGRS